MDKGQQSCAAIGCINNYNNCSYSFFYFPKETVRARTWAIAAGREDLLANLEKAPIRKLLCGLHFENRMFMNKSRNRLGKWAVPTIFPGMEGSSTSSSALNISHGESSASKGEKCSLETEVEEGLVSNVPKLSHQIEANAIKKTEMSQTHGTCQST